MRYLTHEQKEKIKEMMNPAGHNHKECNFFKVLDETPDGFQVEVGYWITYIGCKPRYTKDMIFLPKNK